MQKYPWAANKQKLNRSIAFVNSSLGEQKVTEEAREKMIKEFYVQNAGLVIEEPAPKVRPGRPKKVEDEE